MYAERDHRYTVRECRLREGTEELLSVRAEGGACEAVLRVRGETGVDDMLHGRVRSQEGGDAECILWVFIRTARVLAPCEC
jgi:hypothetical protein